MASVMRIAVLADVHGNAPALRAVLAEIDETPRRVDEVLTRATPDDVLRDALAGVDATLVVGGHTHQQFARGAYVVWIPQNFETRSSPATTTTRSGRGTGGCCGAARRSRSPSRPVRHRCRTRRWR